MTKPCRAASSSMFTTNIDLWCFSFVTLFNLQGTRPSASAAEHVLSYHVARLLSSTFFNFFEVFSALVAAFRRSLRQLIYFTRASRVCQALFSLRSKFFRSRHQRFRRIPDSSSSVSELPGFVKCFFTSLKTFCSRRWHDRRVSDSLLTIPDHSHFVNSFFRNFSTFFQVRPKTFFPLRDIVYILIIIPKIWI